MNTRTLKYSLLATALLISFQNCSQVAFNAIPADPLNNKEALRSLEPALAVRAVGCIQCHANLSANLVTDFGYGDSYYFGRNIGGDVFNNGSPYGDHASSFNTIKMAPDKKVYVPVANLPTELAEATTLTKLSDYIKSEIAAADDSATKAVEVKEISRVYIAAPTEQQLKTVFALGNARMKFIKSGAAELSGLRDNGTFFSNSGTLKCDGDLIVQGPLYLKDLQLETQQGCRIHVIGSVFAYGSVNYVGASELRNLQITATRSINQGLGNRLKADGTTCNADGTAGHGTNSFNDRYLDMWTVNSQATRAYPNGRAMGEAVIADLQVLEAGLGTKLDDAECSAQGRTVSFERILLNAPVVMSRYNGNIKGTIVAEWALMSLGAFKFEFDSVFTNVDVLPKLDLASFLTVQQ